MSDAAERAELAEITLGLRAGRPDAWDRLYLLTHLPILRLLRLHAPKGAQVEDLLQGVFVTAIENIGKFDPQRGTVDGWLAGIARMKLKEARRAARREARVTEFEEANQGETATEAELSEGAETAGAPDAVAAALESLEPRYSEVLRRKYIGGESIEGIAADLGFKPATVGIWLHRGREKFRQAYGRMQAAEAGAGRQAQG